MTSFCREQDEIIVSKSKEVGSELDFLRHISLFLQLNRLWTSLKVVLETSADRKHFKVIPTTDVLSISDFALKNIKCFLTELARVAELQLFWCKCLNMYHK